MKKALSFSIVGFLLLAGFCSWATGAKESAAQPKRAAKVEGIGGLAQYDTIAEFEKATGRKLPPYKQAPMLDDVADLPPVAERLPDNPQIIAPVEEIGQYGGQVNVFTARTIRTGEGAYLSGNDPLLRIAPDLVSIVPNVASSWEFSQDARTITLTLRKGIKWSDGAPFTTEDMLFYYEDFLLNDELSPTKPTVWSPGGKLMVIKKVDDYTFTINFATPYPVAELSLAHYAGANFMTFPKHYLKQFHINYNKDAAKLAKDKGFDNWFQLFQDRNRYGFNQVPLNNELPTIKPFKNLEWTSTYSMLERNPYYWKVDTEGNQLPYIDRIFCRKVNDKEMIDAKIVSGEHDFGAKNTNLLNYPLYKENAEKGNYRVLLWPTTYGGNIIYQPNQTVKDPVLRKIFRDVRFRQALSLAINREEIKETLYFGLGVPRQYTVVPQSRFFEQRFADAYAQFDPEQANRLLDEMGLKWDSNREFRIMPDGRKLAWTLEFYPVTGTFAVIKVNELIREYWKALGCDLILKEETAEFYTQRIISNEVDMNLWTGDKSMDILFITTPQFFIPDTVNWGTNFGVEWARWHESSGKAGEKPPQKILDLYDAWEKLKSTLDKDEQLRLGKKIAASQADNLWVIGTVGQAPVPLCVRNTIRNVVEEGLFGWDLLYTSPYHPEHIFIKQ